MTPDLPAPTNAELEILGILWQHGPQTVKQVHETIRPSRDVGYTTILKLMQLMTEKGLVERDESERSHVYHAAVPEKKIKKRLLRSEERRVGKECRFRWGGHEQERKEGRNEIRPIRRA